MSVIDEKHRMCEQVNKSLVTLTNICLLLDLLVVFKELQDIRSTVLNRINTHDGTGRHDRHSDR